MIDSPEGMHGRVAVPERLVEAAVCLEADSARLEPSHDPFGVRAGEVEAVPVPGGAVVREQRFHDRSRLLAPPRVKERSVRIDGCHPAGEPAHVGAVADLPPSQSPQFRKHRGGERFRLGLARPLMLQRQAVQYLGRPPDVVDVILALEARVNVGFVVAAGRRQHGAVALHVGTHAAMKRLLHVPPGLGARDFAHVVPLPLHARVGIARHDHVVTIRHRWALERVALEDRLVAKVRSRRVDQVVQRPLGHALQIEVGSACRRCGFGGDRRRLRDDARIADRSGDAQNPWYRSGVHVDSQVMTRMSEPKPSCASWSPAGRPSPAASHGSGSSTGMPSRSNSSPESRRCRPGRSFRRSRT